MRYTLSICCVMLTLASPAFGSTHVVRPDGTGDFPTVQFALAAAANGDIIELADGTFEGDGNRDIDFLGKAVTVRSQSGDPEACIIECGGSEAEPHRGFLFHMSEGAGSVLEGVTIVHGWAEFYGGGIFCENSASPTLNNCVLYKNEASYGGGMCGGQNSRITGCSFIDNVAVRGGGLGRIPSAIVVDCVFSGNAATYGGGLYIRSSCSPALTNCEFDGNTASHSGGAAHIEQHCYPFFRYCTFTGNSSAIGGSVDVSIESHPRFRNCTFSGNSCGYTGTISCYEYCLLEFDNCIISFSQQGAAISCSDSEAELRCCNIYGNAGGDWVGYVADQYGVDGNICADPFFCADENPDAPYTLHDGSPCAPGGNPACGLIGAWPVACSVTPAEGVSWGAVKAAYR